MSPEELARNVLNSLLEGCQVIGFDDRYLDQVCTVAAGVLGRHGYHVIEARDGEDALQRSQQHQDAIDRLLTDVVMPRMSGRELAERMLALRPQLEVRYMSGYTDDTALQPQASEPGARLIPKPLRPSGLLTRVREALALP